MELNEEGLCVECAGQPDHKTDGATGGDMPPADAQ